MDVGGIYQLTGQVAVSASGTLWRARDRELGRDVALKQVATEAVDSAQLLRHEAHLLAGLSHPNIVAVFDLIDDGGQLWLVEEWIDGVALDAVVRDAGPLRPEQALGVVRGALQGLAYAHSAGIVHRDVSPTNILLTRDGVSKLVDFGLAAPTGLTGVSGTPGYLSPESARGLPIGPPADVYGAAAVLAMLLRGHPLFDGPTAEAVISQQLVGRAPDLGDVRGSIRTVLRRALADDPNARYSQAQEFLSVLELAARDEYGSDWSAAAGVAALVTISADLAIGAGSTVGSGAPAASAAAQATAPLAQAATRSASGGSPNSDPDGAGIKATHTKPLDAAPRTPGKGRLARRLVARAISHPLVIGVVAVVIVGAAIGVVVAGNDSSRRTVSSPTSARAPISTAGSTPTTSPLTITAAAVRGCPVPAAQLGSLGGVGAVPASISIPAAVGAPAASVVFGTSLPGGLTYYVLGPPGLVCSPGFGSADGGFSQSLNQPGVTGTAISYLFAPGGAGPNQTLACGYIRAVAATCSPPPSTDTITPVTTGDPNIEAATVRVARDTTDPDLGPPAANGLVEYAVFVVTGQGFSCNVGCGAPSVEGSQRAQCALPTTQLAFCRAALDYFVTQSLAAHTPAQAAIIAAINGM